MKLSAPEEVKGVAGGGGDLEGVGRSAAKTAGRSGRLLRFMGRKADLEQGMPGALLLDQPSSPVTPPGDRHSRRRSAVHGQAEPGTALTYDAAGQGSERTMNDASGETLGRIGYGADGENELPGPPAGADDPVSPGSGMTLFEQAVEQNSRRLLAIARAIVGYRASPEDVVQQAIMNLYKHRARYDWRKPGGLLKRAVVNEALRLLRPPRMSMVADDHAASFRAPSSELETSETVRKVREAIDQLPEHFRAALVLCEYEQMSYAQIAETLDASIPQIKTWLHRARRKLATMLEPYMSEATGEAERM